MRNRSVEGDLASIRERVHHNSCRCSARSLFNSNNNKACNIQCVWHVSDFSKARRGRGLPRRGWGLSLVGVDAANSTKTVACFRARLSRTKLAHSCTGTAPQSLHLLPPPFHGRSPCRLSCRTGEGGIEGVSTHALKHRHSRGLRLRFNYPSSF